ncbi:MAG: ribonuclease J [Pseudomonadota bacterium]
MAEDASASTELVFLPLGGAGEIGMNCYLYGAGSKRDRRWLMVDLGITFPGPEAPGVDVILPDITYIAEQVERCEGLLLTHAHEDHFGAVIELWRTFDKPIFATPFTATLLKAKLAAFGAGIELDIREVALGSRFDIGPFDIELVTVAHSIPEPNAVVIRVGETTVLHTGDWKLDPDPITGGPTDIDRLKQLGAEGVDVLICDSTNVFRDGTSPSEVEIAASLRKVIDGCTGRVAVTTFASNVARMKSIADAARATGRTLVVAGRAMQRMIGVAVETGYLAKDFSFHDQDAYGYQPRDKVLLLCTGSQGESRAAMARIAADTHPHITLTSGDTAVFSSRTIPGNEKTVGAVVNALAEQGIEIITDTEALVHVTGHPRREELQQIYDWVKPSHLIPMHGEVRHMKEHVRFAKANGIPDATFVANGSMARLTAGKVEVIESLPSGRIFRDGRLLLDTEDRSVSDRRKLSSVGICVISVVVSAKGEILIDPDVVLDGIPDFNRDGEAMDEIAYKAVDGALESMPKARRKNVETVERAVTRAARSAIGEAWGKKPICKAMVAVI